MATRTISNTGGNYNSTGTWVEGVVPTSADDVIATATSGQLTVNVASAALSLNLSAYTNTITMTNSLTVTNDIRLSSGMSFAGSGALTSIGTATITTNGKLIPAFSFSTSSVVRTLNDDLNCTNLTGSVSATFNGNNLNVQGDLTCGINLIQGTTVFKTTGTGAQNVNFQLFSNTLNFSHSGTVTVNAGAIGPSVNGSVIYTSGSFAAGSALLKFNGVLGTINLSTSGMTWDKIYYLNPSTTTSINLNQDLKFTELYMGGAASSSTPKLSFIGTGRIQQGTIYMGHCSVNTGGLITYFGTNLSFTTGATYNLTNLYTYGDGTTYRNTISSNTAGTKANINVSGITSLNFTQFTDIAMASPTNVLNGSLSNTTNLTNISQWGSATAGGSYTFVN